MDLKKMLVKIHDTGLNQFFYPLMSVLPEKTRDAGEDFFILAQGRTGSRLLAELLNSHDDIYCDKEIFNKTFYLGSGDLFFPMEMLLGKARFFRKKRYGFKDKIYQIESQKKLDGTAKLLKDLKYHRFKIIYLRRENLFKHVLSNKIANMRGSYHAYKNMEEKEWQKLVLDPNEVIEKMEIRWNYQKREQEILKQFDHLTFTYEKDLKDREAQQKTASRIFRYLGVKDVPVATRMKKVNTRKNEDLIANYDEVYEAIKKTPYSIYLDQ